MNGTRSVVLTPGDGAGGKRSGSVDRIGKIAGMVLVALVVALPVFGQDAKVERGKKLYADNKCSLCHAIADQGNKKGPLDGVGAKLSADEIRQWITDAKGMTAKTNAQRKPVMKVYTLPAEDVDALVAYLSSLKKK